MMEQASTAVAIKRDPSNVASQAQPNIPVPTPEENQRLATQIALSKRLSLGIALSLLPSLGLGSLAAIWIGISAYKKIKASNGELTGIWAARWCMCAGFVGLVLSIAFIVILFHRSEKT